MDKDKDYLISAQEVTKVYTNKYFQTTGVRKISLSLEEGDFAALMGPSGSGKSTLLHLFGGLLRPSSGRIFFKNRDIARADFDLTNYRLHSVSFIFQSFNLLSALSVLENIEYPLLLKGIEARPRRESALEILERLGLKDFARRHPNQLSGGQQQRVAVARAIVSKPKIILADEPTANLDSHTAAELIHLMKTLNQDSGITFIFATHDPAILKEAKRIFRLRDGVIE